MAKKSGITKIVIHGEGLKALLRHPNVQADLEQRGARIAATAGPGNEVDVLQGKDRVSAIVKTATREAKLAEAEDRALTRSIGAGR